MYKNIVFDFGGVMVDFDPHKYLIDLFGNRGLEEEVYDLTFGSREWRLLDAGRITRREANERMLQRARAVGRGFEVEGVLDDWMSMLRPRRRMQTLVEQLKQRGYCAYYLSNIPEDVLDLLMHRDFEGLFDGGVASCEVKINKPDPRIYQALLDKYHLRADESIFIDDRADNLVAASALGFGIYEMHNVGTLLRSLPTFGVSSTEAQMIKDPCPAVAGSFFAHLLLLVALAVVRDVHLLRRAGAALRHRDLGQVTLAAPHVVAALADITADTCVFHSFITSLSLGCPKDAG